MDRLTQTHDTGLLVQPHLVGGIPAPLKNMKVNGKDDIPYIMENKTCLKPPTSLSWVYTG